MNMIFISEESEGNARASVLDLRGLGRRGHGRTGRGVGASGRGACAGPTRISEALLLGCVVLAAVLLVSVVVAIGLGPAVVTPGRPPVICGRLSVEGASAPTR